MLAPYHSFEKHRTVKIFQLPQRDLDFIKDDKSKTEIFVHETGLV